MVVALFALSLLMIVGGTAAVVQGFPFVRLESGLAMVIGGTTAASAGALLLGLSALLHRLNRLGAVGPAGALRTAVPAQPEPERTPLSESGRTEPSIPLGASPLGASGLIAGAAIPPTSSAPTFADLAAVSTVPTSEEAAQETLVVPPPAPAEAVSAALRSSLEDHHEPAPAGEPEAPQVVGTYASGGNTYVMFSNGSIQADTPRGRFTFESLDELKAFVADGGESGTRGAA